MINKSTQNRVKMNMQDLFDLQVFNMQRPLLKALVDFKERFETQNGAIYQELLDKITKLQEALSSMQLEKGDKGDVGESYILTPQDIKAIAELVVVPPKIIEKIQVIKEIPVVREIIKEPITQIVKISPQDIKAMEDNIEKNLARLGTVFRDALELLQDEERLSADAIKDLDERIKIVAATVSGSGKIISVGGRGHIKQYDLSDQLNGVLKTFNLPANWAVLAVSSSSMPNAFRFGIDYTYTTTSITFTDQINAAGTLATGQTLIIQYEEA